METKKRRRTWILILLFLLLVVSVFFFTTRYLAMRVEANLVPPQILIHNPVDREEANLYQGTYLNASARSDVGISRIELWVDGEYTTAQQAPETGPISPMILRTFWQPKGVGNHEIILRAYDAQEIEANASVLVRVTDETAPASEPFDPTGILEAGPDAPPEEAAPATEPTHADLPVVPVSEVSEHTPAEAAAPPPPEEEAPSPLFPALEFRFLQLFQFIGEDDDETSPADDGELTILKLEALGLETNPGLEGVHCYIGLGGDTPAWYPDSDSDPATDENFSPLDGTQWNVADFLGEENGVVTAWTPTEPLPIEINCTGTAGGGTEAIDLGTAEVSASPDQWDGITRQIVAAGEGYFTLTYRISHEEVSPKGLDFGMPVPFNLQIDERRQELQWEWEAGDFDGTISGFLIFVNNTLVFQTDATARAARIPYVWFTPPCDTRYEFTVRAYQSPYPEGAYSINAAPVYLPQGEEPRTDCNPKFVISFDTLVTGDLGSDDIDNNWAHMVAPTHGVFFANEKQVEFFNTTLHPNHTYNLNTLVSENGGGMSRFVYELEEGENLRIGYNIVDYDDDSSEVLCSTLVYHDYRYSDLMGYGYFEDTIYSYEDDPQKCVVHYTIQPLEGSAFGSDNPNFMPLPWLDVVGIYTNLSTHEVSLEIKNTGSAAWTNHNLNVGVVRKGSSNITTVNLGPTAIEVGQTIRVATGYTAENLQGLCGVVDTTNEVLELYESTGAYADHATLRYCTPRPDLRIEEVAFNPETSTLSVLVRNMGEDDNDLGSNSINIDDLYLKIDTISDGDTFYSPIHIFGDQVLHYTDAAWLEWQVTQATREKMVGGYTVTIDPDNLYFETDETNNSMSVGGGEYLRITWAGARLRWYPRNLFQDCHNEYTWLDHDEDVWVDVYARTDTTSQLLASWHLETTVSFEENYGFAIGAYETDAYINAEEDLAIEIRGEHENDSMGSATGWFYNFQNWGIMDTIRSNQSCTPGGNGAGITAYPPDSHQRVCGGWTVYVKICQVEQNDD